MLKADRDQIMENLVEEDLERLREFINDYRAKRKVASGGQVLAREMLDAVGGHLTYILRQTMEVVVPPDGMGPH